MASLVSESAFNSEEIDVSTSHIVPLKELCTPSLIKLDACYTFEIDNSNSIRCQIDRKLKKGNHDLFNKVYENHNKLWVHKVTPLEISNYVGYVIGTSVGVVSWLPIVLETNTFAYPYGIVKTVTEHDDVILFKIVEENSFEVYILKDKKYDAINYLQLLEGGYLEEAIEEIKAR